MKEILIPLNFTTTPTVYDTKQSFSTSDEASGVLTFTTTADVAGTVASLTIRNASENANRQTVLIERLDVNTSPFSYTFKNPLPFGQYEGTVLLKKNLTVIASASFLFGVNSSLSAEVLPDLVKAYALDELVENVETEVSNLKDAFNLTVSETVKGVNKTESSLQAQENVRYLNEHQRKANELERIANENARIAAEVERKDTFDTLVDSEVIEQTVAQEVANEFQQIESTYANRLLSTEQQLAEADARIDNVIATAGDGTIPSELTDVRVMVDGYMATTAGGAVRAQFKSVNDNLADFSGIKEISMISGYNVNLSAGVGNLVSLTPEQVTSYRFAIVNCVAGDKFTISGTGGISPRLYGFLDSNNVLLNVSGSDMTATKLVLTAPANSAKIVINTKTASKSYIGESKFSVVNSELAKTNLASANTLDNHTPIPWSEGALIGLGSYSIGDVVSLTPEKNAVWRYAIADCAGVYNFTVSASGGSNARAWGFLDSENKLMSRAAADTHYSHHLLPVPPSAKKIIINTFKDSISYIGSTNIGTLKKDVETLKTGVSTLGTDVSTLRAEVSSLSENEGMPQNTLGAARRISVPAPSLQVGTGSPSLMLSGTGTTRIPYWSMSGTSTWQTLTGYIGDVGGRADGVEISIIALGTGEPTESDYDVFSVITSSLVDGTDVDSNKSSSNPVIFKALPERVTSRRVLESFVPIDPSNPMFVNIRRRPEDPLDTWASPTGVVALEVKPVNVPKPIAIQPEVSYNTWPFVVALGEKVVCVYSRGYKHGNDTTRTILRRVSVDQGKTWSSETQAIDTPSVDDALVGKGKDSNGNILLWIRRGGVGNPSLHLYRSSDGDSYTLLTSPTFADVPYHIGDIFHAPSVGLMAFYNGGGYDGTEPTKSWGIVVSADNGLTWTQQTVENNLDRNDWPTEISGVYVGDGRILAIGRSENDSGTTEQTQYQLQSDDYGVTWTRMLTNITDVLASSPSVVYDPIDGMISVYYFQRAMGVLRVRKANVSDLWGKAMAWPPSKPLAIGTKNASDTGNANATAIGNSQIVVYYSGDSTNSGIYGVVVE